MKMKTGTLFGPALDWAVAKCESVNAEAFRLYYRDAEGDGDLEFHYSTNWAQGGPIIERERITISYEGLGVGEPLAYYLETMFDPEDGWHQHGGTPLVAAMRCYAAKKLGDVVEVPDELLKGKAK